MYPVSEAFLQAVQENTRRYYWTVSEVVSDAVADSEKHIWDFLMGKIGNAYGAAGLMGNLYAESGLRPDNLQNSYEKSLNMSDKEY